MRGLLVSLLLVWPIVASAHDSGLDDCRGHTTENVVNYGVDASGTEIASSEAGEYHFHFTPDQIAQARQSLYNYRKERGLLVNRPDDFGSFTVDGITYDIWQYTRQSSAIIHCVSDDDVLHSGIVRIKVTP